MGSEAVGTLRLAVASGWSDALRISRDPDLVPLHDLDTFRQVVAELLDRQFPVNPFAR